jgi:hypothetical protein
METALAIGALRSVVLRTALFCAAYLPIVTPGIVSAISLRTFIRLLDLDPGSPAITLGHAVHAAPFVVIVLAGRLRAVPMEQVEAVRPDAGDQRDCRSGADADDFARADRRAPVPTRATCESERLIAGMATCSPIGTCGPPSYTPALSRLHQRCSSRR